MLTQLFNELKRELDIVYSISIDRSQVVDLDSSTNEKFSRHWIVHLPDGILFRNNRQAGIFIKSFLFRLLKEKDDGNLQSRGHAVLADYLFVGSEKQSYLESSSSIIDTTVYTRNRLFRLLGSKKRKKNTEACLRIAKENTFPFPDEFDNSKFYLPAKKSMLPKKVSQSLSHSSYQ